MSKKAFIGVDGFGKNVKKIYVGVDGFGKKVVKGFIGVDGFGKQFWPPEYIWNQYTIEVSFSPSGGISIYDNYTFEDWQYMMSCPMIESGYVDNNGNIQFNIKFGDPYYDKNNYDTINGIFAYKSGSTKIIINPTGLSYPQDYAIGDFFPDYSNPRHQRCRYLTATSGIGDLLGQVTSNNSNAYPENGVQDGYWYVRQ